MICFEKIIPPTIVTPHYLKKTFPTKMLIFILPKIALFRFFFFLHCSERSPKRVGHGFLLCNSFFEVKLRWFLTPLLGMMNITVNLKLHCFFAVLQHNALKNIV